VDTGLNLPTAVRWYPEMTPQDWTAWLRDLDSNHD
jgi:hypothetical protein